jgi:hypothetical protein
VTKVEKGIYEYCYVLLAINVKAYQFELSVKGDQIIRQKLQISN